MSLAVFAIIKSSFYKFLIQFKYRQKGLLRNFNITALFHSLLSFFLFFKQFTFTTDITTITFCSNVFSYTLYSLTRYNLSSDSSLYGYIELLARNKISQLLTHPATKCYGIILMRQCRKRINRFSVKQNIQLG